MNQFVTIRIKETGQVTEMVLDVARAMIAGGTAEEVKSSSKPIESMTRAGGETAVAAAQTGSSRKPARRSTRSSRG